MSYYTPRHFSAKEWVPPEIYAIKGEGSFVLLDNRILMIYDSVRDFFGVPVTVNNYTPGKPVLPNQFSQRGLRTVVQPGGDKYGPHFYGRAGDSDVHDMKADVVRAQILKNLKYGNFSLITGMEINITWLHLDCANRNYDGVQTFGVPT